MSDVKPRASIKLADDFLFGELRPEHKVAPPPAKPAPLGPLAALVGDWVGNGFNTIFRPDNSVTPNLNHTAQSASARRQHPRVEPHL